MLVICLAAAAAIVGDNVGYLIGRHGGRRLLERPGAFEHHRRLPRPVDRLIPPRHAAEDIFKIGGLVAAAFIVLVAGGYVFWRRRVA